MINHIKFQIGFKLVSVQPSKYSDKTGKRNVSI